MAIRITAPLNRETVRTLKAGDSCLISGVKKNLQASCLNTNCVVKWLLN